MEYYPINIEKYQAMKKYNKCNHFISSFIQFSLLAMLLGLFLSSPLWLPNLLSSINLFFMETFPKIIEIVLGPKCLFLVFNLIIVFLVGESRLSSSSSKRDIYEEYVMHARSLKGASRSEDKGNEVALVVSCLVEEKEEDENEVENDKEEDLEEELVVEEELEEELEEEEEEREEKGLPTEELNRRVEDFIARVNMQRRMEARLMLVCCG